MPLLGRYDGRQVVVYAIINTEGRFEQLTMKDSPGVELNAPIHAVNVMDLSSRHSSPASTSPGITLAAQ
jgi:hypothetical protein